MIYLKVYHHPLSKYPDYEFFPNDGISIDLRRFNGFNQTPFGDSLLEYLLYNEH